MVTKEDRSVEDTGSLIPVFAPLHYIEPGKEVIDEIIEGSKRHLVGVLFLAFLAFILIKDS